MSIRVDVQLDHGSESLRWIATATLDGKRLHEIGKHGGLKECDELLVEVAGDETGTSRQRRRSLQRAGVPDSWLSEPAQSDELGAFMVSGDR
jgi:hypothetical protein